MRSILYHFNLLATLICIVGALIERDIYAGYLYLGLFQVIVTFIVTFAVNGNGHYVKELVIYWVLVLAFFVLGILFRLNNAVYIISPMLIALYNCYAYYKVYKLEI